MPTILTILQSESTEARIFVSSIEEGELLAKIKRLRGRVVRPEEPHNLNMADILKCARIYCGQSAPVSESYVDPEGVIILVINEHGIAVH